MSRKRDKPYFSRQSTSSISKRRHPLPPYLPPPTEDEDKPTSPPAVVVMGLPQTACYISYRSKESVECAIAASLYSSFSITIDSKKVQVLWATDPLAQWTDGVGVDVNKDNGSSSSSKFLRPEVPLSRHVRGNKLASAIVNPRSTDDGSSMLEVPFKAREIVGYDDIL
ncbi:hypothetical protein CRYUN_Cryun06bG0111100 [Craigia yunnanensis]